jgi:murein endopeptidase
LHAGDALKSGPTNGVGRVVRCRTVRAAKVNHVRINSGDHDESARRRTRGRPHEGSCSMTWRRDEVWFDADVLWFREASGGQGAVAALLTPAFFGLVADDLAVDVPNGLAASRQRRAELRSRRNVLRARVAALVVAPATLLPIAGQRLGLGSSGGALQDDPPSVVRDPMRVGSGLAAAFGSAGRGPAVARALPKIQWHRATSHGLQYSGWLTDGTQLPVEGADWVTWNPVTDTVPNEPHRLYGHERTIRTVVSVLAAYRAANPDAPRVVVGDISFRNGGPMEAHVSHENGLDVDIYYPRRDGLLRAPRANDQIDRQLAQDLLDRFVAAGALKVFVGFSTGLRGPREVVVPYPNHGDHMHVRFPRPRG